MRPREKSREGLAWRQQLYPFHTHALSPSFLRICKPQSQVLRYLCASRPCKIPACHRTQQPALVPSTPPPSWPHPTCIRVLITSKGVFPKTLAAPAITPNTPVTSGFMGLLGLSPGCGQGERKVKGPALSTGEEHEPGPLREGDGGHLGREAPKYLEMGSLGRDARTSIPVA